MSFQYLFSAYLALVVLGTVGVVVRWLDGRVRVASLAVLVVWLAYAGALGFTGIAARTNQVPPGIALLATPIVMVLLVLTLSGPGAMLSRRIPLRLLLGYQVFRVGVELSLHHLWVIGLAPRIMTLEGGNIEILVAATAPAAAWLASRRPAGLWIAWIWNLIGLLSLANIVARAVLSAPGPLQMIHAEVPDVALLTFPFTFIPGFMVPLALSLHVLAFSALGANS